MSFKNFIKNKDTISKHLNVNSKLKHKNISEISKFRKRKIKVKYPFRTKFKRGIEPNNRIDFLTRLKLKIRYRNKCNLRKPSFFPVIEKRQIKKRYKFLDIYCKKVRFNAKITPRIKYLVPN